MYTFEQVWIQAITDIHVGCGQSGSSIDLPIIRERATGFPFLPASGNRGAMRTRAESKDPDLTTRLFGHDGAGEDSSGCFIPPEGYLLLFPVQSSKGVFQWITCPFMLCQFQQHRAYYRDEDIRELDFPELNDQQFAGGRFNNLYLGEFIFERPEGEAAAWQFDPGINGVDPQKILLVNDEVFKYFVSYQTVVLQHNRLDAHKRVINGALFSLEYLPSYSICYGFLGACAEHHSAYSSDEERITNPAEVLENVKTLLDVNNTTCHLQLGGKESTGKGFVKMQFVAPASHNDEEE